jgi:hypothetical protein
MNVDWLLPYTRPKAFKAGDVLMARGEYATAAYYVVSGEVEIVELNEVFGKGTFLGEIGLFTPDGKRTLTVRCKTDVQTAMIDYDRFKELYFQNPQFGFRCCFDRCAHAAAATLQPACRIARPPDPGRRRGSRCAPLPNTGPAALGDCRRCSWHSFVQPSLNITTRSDDFPSSGRRPWRRA